MRRSCDGAPGRGGAGGTIVPESAIQHLLTVGQSRASATTPLFKQPIPARSKVGFLVISNFRRALDSVASNELGGPALPLGRRIELGERGNMFVREIDGPAGAPTVVLLHGWLASGGLNWFQVFDELAGRYRVLAPDLRGHGRGIRTRQRFTLSDCADDVAAMMDAVGCGPAIIVGYSMGGPVATLLWKQHPDKVAALGLCATGQEFMAGNRARYSMRSTTILAAASIRMGGWAAWLPRELTGLMMASVPPDRRRPATFTRWAQAELRRHDPRMVLEAGTAIANFSSKGWAPNIDAPTTVMVTELDTAVKPLAQRRLARAIPDARVQRFGDGHLACINPRFGLAVAKLCDGLAERAERSRLV